jgi:hypothetical protein
MKDIFRIKAFIIHLAISLLVIGLVSLLVFRVWFPYPFYVLDGTGEALVILFLADLLLGPSLTLLVASSKKKLVERYFDFSLIGLFQCLALGFGLMEISSQQVGALVMLNGKFYPVPKDSMAISANVSAPNYQGIHYGYLNGIDYMLLSDDRAMEKIGDPSAYKLLSGEYVEVHDFEVVRGEVGDRSESEVVVRLVGKVKDGLVRMSADGVILDISVAP